MLSLFYDASAVVIGVPASDRFLHSYFDISSEDDVRKRREKVQGRSRPWIDHSKTHCRTFRAAGNRRRRGSACADGCAIQEASHARRNQAHPAARILNQPLIVIFEDLHWIDRRVAGLLNLLADSIGTARILLLVNYPPEYSHGWGQQDLLHAVAA